MGIRERARVWCAILAALGLLLLAAACSVGSPPADEHLSSDQASRAEVLEAFLTDPDAAVARYQPLWDAALPPNGNLHGQFGDYTLLAIAQGMVAHGHGDPAEFLRFAQEKSRSADVNLIEASLWVLAGGDDEASLDTLFTFLPDQRGTASMGAESAIAYRRAAAREAGRAADLERIERRIASWCAEPSHTVRPLCAYTGGGESENTP